MIYECRNTPMPASGKNISELAAIGRRLLDGGPPFETHREFSHWVEEVAIFLDSEYPGTGQSAIWSALPASVLVTGSHYYDTPTVWNTFYSAVRDRLAWLGELGNAGQLIAVGKHSTQQPSDSRCVFVVHGHDDALKSETARTLTALELDPIILHVRPNRGQTIIEKFERESNVGFAVILLSPDDFGYAHINGKASGKNRARQNVLLELGYFVGKLGRSRVFALKQGDLEIPTDFAGVVYTPYDNAGGWRFVLARELATAGYKVDLNKLIAQ